MNRSQRIYLDTGTTDTNKYIICKLEQEVDTIEFMTMNIYTKDAYQDFNSDYGVLVGRVIANGGIGIPNAKISIFIPLDDIDANDGEIASIYPYKTPRDKNAEGKRYNLLPRVAQYEPDSGTYKPKQPFGSFPIKPEIVTNQSFLDVYKKYYKYTALTNSAGDYMIFGVPVGTQTVHMSVDITDIGKYSMTPPSMVIAGYPANLFTDGGKAIKPSTDLSDLPNIETQEISVNVIPFWGDTTNFTIGITRQDFRIRAILWSTFTIFGTSMTMGENAVFGNPDASQKDKGFYPISYEQENNIDIRVNRTAPIDFRIFSYRQDVNMSDVDAIINGDINGPVNTIDTEFDIYELDKSEYFIYNNPNGEYLITVPCNRNKIITDEFGNQTPVADDYPYGVFTKFYGMALVKYDDNATNIPINKTFNNNYIGDHPGRITRSSWFKIPQNTYLTPTEELAYNSNVSSNDLWRLKYYSFTGGEIYSVAQFLPTKNTKGSNNSYLIPIESDTINYLSTTELTNNRFNMGGLLFKVGGIDRVSQSQYDNLNYVGNPPNAIEYYRYLYDLSPNATFIDITGNDNYYFGGQWLNFCLIFPQLTYINSSVQDIDRLFAVADVYTNYYLASFASYFRADNMQKIFGGYTNTKFMLRGDAFRTDFINISKNDLVKINNIQLKGINIARWNYQNPSNKISTSGFKYLTPDLSGNPTSGLDYGVGMKGWDYYLNPFYYGDITPTTDPITAYLFKGMYNSNCVKMLVDYNIL